MVNPRPPPPVDSPLSCFSPLASPGLNSINLAELWHDERYHQEWINNNVFLPVINNWPDAKHKERSPVR